MQEQQLIKKLALILIAAILIFGNISCNKNGNEETDHFCLIQKPVGGEVWFQESVNNIQWMDNYSDFVRIELFVEDVHSITIAESVENSGVYQWHIPDDLKADKSSKIRITSVKDESVSDQSIHNFTIREPFLTDLLIDERDGQSYKTLKIADRWWMAENLNFTTDSGSMSYFDDPTYSETFGRLYLWEAAMIACPDGWEIPCDDEWKELEMKMGLREDQLNQTGLRGSDAGKQMKEGGGSGFNALYAGYYHGFMPPYRCGHVHIDTRFWTSTKVQDQENHVWRRFLVVGDDGIDRNTTWITNGNSVRCIKSK